MHLSCSKLEKEGTPRTVLPFLGNGVVKSVPSGGAHLNDVPGRAFGRLVNVETAAEEPLAIAAALVTTAEAEVEAEVEV
jgi:hypothetical protein